ncbi:MAG: aminotransferase class I/II-fold pyridoxal phosphate-dependent enzyme [Vampirovibrionales bacterium]|nr:aminotransferase class I/II-fold pyridoxal phosphate-dependent enzyme [Vampirovibrionales bacterium]
MADGPIAKAIAHYLTLQRRRFHVPGHAGRLLFESPGLSEALLAADLSEVEGLDVLSQPEGCIATSQALAASIYGVGHSFYLINGASVGLQAAMLATLRPGDDVLIARNAHRSLISGLILTGANPIWLWPERLSEWGLWAALTSQTVRSALEAHPNARLVAMTSPTYEGIGSDIDAIAEICRAYGALTLVDEAHGALWPFSEDLPPTAAHARVDVVVHSLHKSAGSLTQTAIAHLPHGSGVSPSQFQQALNALQTTSPSYPLLASAEAAVLHLASPAGRAQLQNCIDCATRVRHELQRELRHLRLFSPKPPSDAIASADLTALYLAIPDVAGDEWGVRLEQECGIAFEATTSAGALYKRSLGLLESDDTALIRALCSEDQRLRSLGACCAPELAEGDARRLDSNQWRSANVAMTPRDAFFSAGERVCADDAVGRIAQETLVHCPPGIPITVPGERISSALREALPDTVTVVREP